MKKLLIAIAMLVATSATSRADFFFGEDLADAQSGSALNLVEGSTTTLEVWIFGNQDQNIRGVSFSLNSDTAGVVNSSNLLIDDLTARWPLNNLGDAFADRTAESANGVLINDAQLAVLGQFSGTGVTFDGSPIRLGTVDISADVIGVANLTFAEGGNEAIDQDGAVTGFVSGGRTINVTAVPEPGSLIVLALAATQLAVRRRR